MHLTRLVRQTSCIPLGLNVDEWHVPNDRNIIEM